MNPERYKWFNGITKQEQMNYMKQRALVVANDIPRLIYFTSNVILHVDKRAFADHDYFEVVKQFAGC